MRAIFQLPRKVFSTMFASIHVPDFSVEAIVRHQPELRQKPVVIVDGKPPVLMVAGVNSLARQAGIELGMTKFQAEQFVDAAIRRRSASQEASAQAALLAVTRGRAGIYNIAEDDGVVSIGKARAELGFDPQFRLGAETRS